LGAGNGALICAWPTLPTLTWAPFSPLRALLKDRWRSLVFGLLLAALPTFATFEHAALSLVHRAFNMLRCAGEYLRVIKYAPSVSIE